MYIIIIGCGRLGSTLAKELSDNGHDICILDRDDENLERLGSGFNGLRIKGVEYDNDKLMEAGIDRADALLAVTHDDNVNITVSMIADRVHKVPKVIARVNEPNKKFIYETIGIDTINPVQSGVDVLKSKLLVERFDVLAELWSEHEIVELLVDRQVTCTVSEIESKCSCLLSGLIRGCEMSLPKKDDTITKGDRLIATIRSDDKKKLMGLLTKEMFV
jgi:trk system potassium uptake protein TrkA